MFICKICNKEFKNIAALVSHISNPKLSCKITSKDYYDKFLRKENEGICQFCGKETLFCGLIKGYPNNTCKHCRNKKPEAKILRSKKYEIKKENKKIESGYYDLSEQCEICKENGEIKKFKSKQGLSKHISHIHSEVGIKNYYDKYLKKDREGICKISGKETTFLGLIDGYCEYKGKGTNSKDQEIKLIKEQTIFKNYGVLHPCYVNAKERILKQKETVNKRIDLKNERSKLLNILRILSIDKSNKLQCQICGKNINNFTSISVHIHKKHHLLIKKYYDMFFKKEGEGICPISNLETNFCNLERGYNKYHISFITFTDEIKNGSKKSQLEYIHNKIRSFQSSFQVELFDIDKIENIGDKTKIKCLICNNIYENRFTNLMIGFGKCPKCFPNDNTKSKPEIDLLDNIKSLIPNEEILNNYKGLIKNPNTGNNLEIDIYIPNKNFAIEFNGLYWHSEQVAGKDAENKHLIKWNECKNKNVQLIQIFEDEWTNKKEIILSMIKHKLGYNSNKVIYARKCIIKEIDSNIKNNFLENNHIQGKDLSKIKLGAFYNNELISVMTFGLGNISRGGNPYDLTSWELSRFVSKKEYKIIGIAGKLLEYFKRNYDWKNIYSYADLRFSNGNLYKKLGFELIKQNSPNYFYVDTRLFKRIHRYNLRKLPSEPKDVPEWKLRYDQGYYRIWDCGNLKFNMTNNKI